MEKLTEALANHSFMNGLEPRHIARIMKHASQVIYDPGTYVFGEEEVARSFYLIRTGRIHIELVTEDGAVLVQSVGPGEILGWSWLLPPHKWHFGAEVVERSEMLIVDGKALRQEMEADHEFGYRVLMKLIEVIAQRVEGSRIQLKDLTASGGKA